MIHHDVLEVIAVHLSAGSKHNIVVKIRENTWSYIVAFTYRFVYLIRSPIISSSQASLSFPPEIIGTKDGDVDPPLCPFISLVYNKISGLLLP